MTRLLPIQFAAAWWRVALGGATGAGVRWAVLAWAAEGTAFPWPTLLVNVAGCLIVGALIGAPPALRASIGMGFAGGLTTFSTLTVELATLLRSDDVALAIVYLVASLVLGVGAVLVGRRISAVPFDGSRPVRPA